MGLEKMKLKSIIEKIRSRALDDYLEEDPIAEALYDRFLTVNGVRSEPDWNELLENILKTARILVATAYFDKHPESKFDDKYLGPAYDVFDEDQAVIDTMMAAYVTVMMCPEAPKNMERFAQSAWFYLGNETRRDAGYMETFRKLRQELKEDGHSYTIDDLLLSDPTVNELTTADWKKITKNYNLSEIEKVVNEGRTGSIQFSILSAIEARYKIDSIKESKFGITTPFDGVNNFINSLRSMVLLRMEQESAVIMKKIPAGEDPLMDDVRRLESEKEEIRQTLEKERDAVQEKLDNLQKEFDSLSSAYESEKSYNIDLEQRLSEKQDQDNVEDTDSNDNTAKCKSVVLMKMLDKMGAGASVNDKTKIASLAQYFFGGSYRKLYNTIQEGIVLTNYHDKEIARVNKILSDLGLDITVVRE